MMAVIDSVNNRINRAVVITITLVVILCGIVDISSASIETEEPKPTGGVVGIVKQHAEFKSKFVDARNVDVWLPPGYDQNKNKKYPVLYMHDGQNLFDPARAYIGVDWGIDETMTRLIGEGKVRAAIVVGIWNTPKRIAEYMPRKAVESVDLSAIKNFSTITEGQIVSDDYLKFLVQELKPFIDSTYRTRSDRANTFIMGSSMGGLISAYAISEYPNVFGGAGCVSTHWPAADGAMINYLKKTLPSARTHKIYFDFGTETLDAQYEPYQQKMDEVMKAAGYQEGKNWITRKFVGEDHSERAWRKRVDIPLVFLIGK
jgi:predicted alpha/beta superfamily hydrolase